MDIKYVEVPVRVKPHTEYLDMKGVDALWEQIKDYVREHGGENTQGSVNAEEVNAIIKAYYDAHRDELKGEPFTFEDLTPEQIEALRGAPGKDGTITFDELTDEQKASLKGDKGETGATGAAFTYDMFTVEQLEALRGPKGADGTMTFSDLTEEQRESLRGPQGEQGIQGPIGPEGPRGVQGIPGAKGEPGIVDYTLVYTRTEVDELLKNVDLDPDKIDLSNYYVKDETYNKGQIDNLIASLVIEGAAGVHIGTDEPTIAGVSVWVDTDGVPYEGDTGDLTDIFYKKDYIDDVMETHVHRLSEMENDIGFVTSTEAVPTKLSQLENDAGYVLTENVYKKAETYTKTEVQNTLNEYWKKTEQLPECHTHFNKNILDNMYELNGNLMYKGTQVSGSTSGDGGTIDLSAYALQAAVNQQIDTVANAKVDKTTYDSKMTQIDTSLESLDDRITDEAEARANADTALNNRVKALEDADYQTEADVLLLLKDVEGGEVNVDLTNYYTKGEVDGLIENVDVDLTGYATTDHNHDSQYSAFGHQHTNYAPSVHTHDEYITETELDTALSGLSTGGDDVEVKFKFYDDRNYAPSGDYYADFTDANNNKEYGQNYLWVDVCINGEHNYFPAFNNATASAVDLSDYAKLNDSTQVITANYLYATGINLGSGSLVGSDGMFRLTGTWVDENGLNRAQQLHFPLKNGTLATLDDVNAAVANSSGGSTDLTGYATETYVQQQIAAIEHPTTDLSGYAKTTDIPDVSAFRTEEQIIALIQQYGGGSGENLPSSEEVSY